MAASEQQTEEIDHDHDDASVEEVQPAGTADQGENPREPINADEVSVELPPVATASDEVPPPPPHPGTPEPASTVWSAMRTCLGARAASVATKFGSCIACVGSEMGLFARCVRSASPDRLSAVVLFLLLFCVMLTCTVARYLMASHPDRFPSYVVSWLVMGMEALGVVGLTLVMCCARSRVPDADDADLQPVHRFLRRNLKLFGIVPFYFAILVYDVFHVIADWTCFDAWVACTDYDIYAIHVTELGYPFMRSVFLFVEMVFCVRFNAAHLYQNTLLLFALAIVQATNFFGWLDALVDESEALTPDRNWTVEVTLCFNETPIVNVSSHFVDCYRRTTGEYHLLESASPYLFPFIVEYLMLVIESIADWFFTDADDHADAVAGGQAPAGGHAAVPGNGRSTVTSQHEPVPPRPSTSHETLDAARLPRAPSAASAEILSLTGGAIGGEQQPVASTSHVDEAARNGSGHSVSRATSSASIPPPNEHTPLLGRSPSVPRSAASLTSPPAADFHVVNEVDVLIPATMCDRCPWFFIFVVLSVVVSVLFVIFGILDLSLGQVAYRNVFIAYRACYWLALCFAGVVGYAASRHFTSGPTRPTAFEYFVAMSSGGVFLQCIFTTVANVMTPDALVPTSVFLFEEITNIAQIAVQVVFYAYARSVQVRTDAAPGSDEDRLFQRRRAILIGVLSYFAVCNAALWVEDSFIETRNSMRSWQQHYFDEWPLIYTIFNPLVLVFRFNSVSLFLIVLFDKKR